MRANEIIIENETPEKILQDRDAHAAVDLATDRGRRWPAAEEFILENPDAFTIYAKNVIGGRWPEAEAQLESCKERYLGWALYYALDIVGDRWPEGEHNMALGFGNNLLFGRDRDYYVLYAKNYAKGRLSWLEDCLYEIVDTDQRLYSDLTDYIVEVSWGLAHEVWWEGAHLLAANVKAPEFFERFADQVLGIDDPIEIEAKRKQILGKAR
jgi:hypothetical protein